MNIDKIISDNISSTEIRDKISKGEDITHLVPEAIAKLIK